MADTQKDQLLGLNEVESLEAIATFIGSRARTRVLTEVSHQGKRYPIRSIVFGTDDPTAPVFALFGGVHGLEKIGSEVVLAYLRGFGEYAGWDLATQDALKRIRVVFVPIVNPVGVVSGTRSNGNGVDIMRNAPIDSHEKVSPALIYRGHRLSSRLPWYRGMAGAPMEVETQAVVDFVKQEIFPSRLSICVDVHSGFGAVDRLWFPYATAHRLIPDVGDAYALKELLDRTLPNHVYAVEPQSRQYTTHGDVWDYLYEMHRKDRKDPSSLFLPMTLEMGSWNWLKKNPLHAFRAVALFHPIKSHRIRRVLRRHGGLFDFLTRAALNGPAWRIQPGDEARRRHLEAGARKLWQV
jgi:hypothetical protein